MASLQNHDKGLDALSGVSIIRRLTTQQSFGKRSEKGSKKGVDRLVYICRMRLPDPASTASQEDLQVVLTPRS